MTDLETKRKARKLVFSEFDLKPKTMEILEDKMSMERYNIVKRSDGQKVPSTRWSCPVEQLWTWNNAVPDAKGHRNFVTAIKVDGRTFNRRSFLAEPIFRSDLQRHISAQIMALGYPRCWFKPSWRTDPETEQEYQTFVLHVQIQDQE